jgi:hypothetical protein
VYGAKVILVRPSLEETLFIMARSGRSIVLAMAITIKRLPERVGHSNRL